MYFFVIHATDLKIKKNFFYCYFSYWVFKNSNCCKFLWLRMDLIICSFKDWGENFKLELNGMVFRLLKNIKLAGMWNLLDKWMYTKLTKYINIAHTNDLSLSSSWNGVLLFSKLFLTTYLLDSGNIRTYI